MLVFELITEAFRLVSVMAGPAQIEGVSMAAIDPVTGMIASAAIGAGASLFGGSQQRKAQEEIAEKQIAAQEAATAANIRAQKVADVENYLRALQAQGYNTGVNPFLPEDMRYAPMRLPPWMVVQRETLEPVDEYWERTLAPSSTETADRYRKKYLAQ